MAALARPSRDLRMGRSFPFVVVLVCSNASAFQTRWFTFTG